MHKRICTTEEMGVPRPISNRPTPGIWLIRYTTGMRTQKAPTMPCTITKTVLPQPLK